MKNAILIIAFSLSGGILMAQKKTTTSAIVSFDATTKLDALPKAENRASIASLDTKTGALGFEVTIKNFSFTNPMMQEHFNGKGWMDSDQFPTATFKGEIKNLSDINFKADGSYDADIEGLLSIHGVTNPVKTKAAITVTGKKINALSEFSIKLADYQISGPAVGAGKVTTEPKIRVAAEFK